MRLSDFWTVIDHSTRKPILPFDSNPGSDDEGMLVYCSQHAAECAAEHQSNMYDVDCQACRLGAANIDLKQTRKAR